MYPSVRPGTEGAIKSLTRGRLAGLAWINADNVISSTFISYGFDLQFSIFSKCYFLFFQLLSSDALGVLMDKNTCDDASLLIPLGEEQLTTKVNSWKQGLEELPYV